MESSRLGARCVALAIAIGLGLAAVSGPAIGSAKPLSPGGQAGQANEFPHPLLKKTDDLGVEATTDTSSQQISAKKFQILAIALANLSGEISSTKVEDLSNPKDYVLNAGQTPHYFSTAFTPNPAIKVTPNDATRYDYTTKAQGPFQLWLDFASPELGGGAFTDGMLEEETMVLETPELANLAAQVPRPKTRDGDGKGPMASNPTPKIFRHVRRTIELQKESLKDDKWKTIAIKDFLHVTKPLPANQVFNVLALAVAHLTSSDDQKKQETINDLFNTFDAGFRMTNHSGGQDSVINTGPIGTGNFKHDHRVVYVMQHLAAQQTGVNLVYWGLTNNDQTAYDKVVNEIIAEYNKDKSKPGYDTISHLLVLAQKHLK
jgi:hypothetical protein